MFNYRTCPAERGYLVLQIGTSDAKRAAQVAKFLEQGEHRQKIDSVKMYYNLLGIHLIDLS